MDPETVKKLTDIINFCNELAGRIAIKIKSLEEENLAQWLKIQELEDKLSPESTEVT